MKAISALRMLWRNSPSRKQALARVALGKGWYRCSECTKETEKPHVDHVEPIGEFKDWNTFVEDLFCHEINLRVLCSFCHKAKTKLEAAQRAEAKREAKKKLKESLCQTK